MSFFALHVDEVQRTYRLFIIIIYRFLFRVFGQTVKLSDKHIITARPYKIIIKFIKYDVCIGFCVK